MSDLATADAADVLGAFRVAGTCTGVERHGSGHIHHSWVAACGGCRYLLQRLNTRVFPDVPALMDNIRRVTIHLRDKSGGAPCLTLVETADAAPALRDGDGNWWRVFEFIEGATSVDSVGSPAQAREAAAAFGRFVAAMSDLPPPRLNETIPDFHNTPARLAALERSVAADAHNRAAQADQEIAFALSRRDTAGILAGMQAANIIPERVTHNDTKINNVLFDASGRRALCVVDLDTVMPGLVPWDFGDLVRTAATRAAEDEQDLSRVTVEPDLFQALAEGFLSEAGPLLAPGETDALALAGAVIALECGIRFLTDHIEGDVYFRIHRPDQNLDRCRAQFTLARELERHAADLARILGDARSRL